MIISTGKADLPQGHRFTREAGFAYWTLVYDSLGRSTFETPDGMDECPPRVFRLIRRDTPYRLHCLDASHEAWVIFDPRPEWMRLLEWTPLLPGLGGLTIADGRTRRQLAEAVYATHRAFHESPREAQVLASNLLERFFLLAHLANPSASQPAYDERVRRALDRIHAQPNHRWTVAELARAVHTSASHLAHLFAEQVGQPLIHYAEGRRLDRARELLLHTNLPIKRIAEEVGFDNAFHFSTRFRKRIGQSPRAFRASPRGKAR